MHIIESTMEVIASDRPGLLSRIGIALAVYDARLYNAKTATYGSPVEDIFFITDKEGQTYLLRMPIKTDACLSKFIIDTLARDLGCSNPPPLP